MMQLGFGFEQMAEEARTAHLPTTMEEAIPFYRGLIERHHAAMMAGDAETAAKIRGEAEDLAVKLNGGTLLGILGGEDSPGRTLERETAAPPGTIPLWGQQGDFTITVNGIPTRIEIEGMFGLGFGNWPGFAAHAVDPDKPFFSETGYRSFLGIHADPCRGLTPDDFCRRVIEQHVAKECKGKSCKIETSYAERIRGERAAHLPMTIKAGRVR